MTLQGKTKSKPRRAIALLRVSLVGDREGESFYSPSVQRERIEDVCKRDGLRLVDVVEEMNVSGGASLEKRHGLRRAVERIEAGEADVLVVAYFDRLVRSYKVQAEVVERVEAAGGSVLAVDVGQVTNGSAGQWLSGYFLGGVSEYQRRTIGERTAEARQRAVARGVPTFPLPPGLRRIVLGRDENGVELGGVEHDPHTGKHIVRAFELRAGGASVREVREYLRRNGIDRSHHGVQELLTNRVYRGEIRHGPNVNLEAFDPLIPADLFDRVQRTKGASRGRKAKSDRLLARLGVLRCASCCGRMSVGTTMQQGQRYPFYRCSPTSDCTQRVTISAELVESVTVAAVLKLIAGMTGSAANGAEKAERSLEKAQADLDAAFRAFTGFDDEPAARKRLAELRDDRDAKRDRRDQLLEAANVTVDPLVDWDALSLDEQRALIRAVIDRVVVAPGRGPERITVGSVGG